MGIHLTSQQRLIMNRVGTGADIWTLGPAQICRTLEKRGLVMIVNAQRAPRNGAERQPHFGAKLTAAGWRALERR